MSTVGERVPEIRHAVELARWRAKGWRFRGSRGGEHVASRGELRLYGATLGALLERLAHRETHQEVDCARS